MYGLSWLLSPFVVATGSSVCSEGVDSEPLARAAALSRFLRAVLDSVVRGRGFAIASADIWAVFGGNGVGLAVNLVDQTSLRASRDLC